MVRKGRVRISRLWGRTIRQVKGIAAVAVLAAVLVAPAAQAGGSFERIVAVGAGGASRAIVLAQSGPHSATALTGTAVAAPAGGYVRLYTFIGTLPAEPGRFYPGSSVACLSWQSAPAGCVKLGSAGAQLLSPFRGLAPRHDELTVPTSVSFSGHMLAYARANVLLAFELAFERPAVTAGSTRRGMPLEVAWKGPDANGRPRALILTPAGLVANGELRPLSRGIWCYVALNIPDRLKSFALDAAIAAERC